MLLAEKAMQSRGGGKGRGGLGGEISDQKCTNFF